MPTKITTPQTQIGIAWADLIALVPRRAQGRAIEIALILQAEYAMGELSAERDGFTRGVTQADATRTTNEDGYKAGFEKGWDRATLDVLSRTGVPAVTPTDEETDVLLPPC